MCRQPVELAGSLRELTPALEIEETGEAGDVDRRVIEVSRPRVIFAVRRGGGWQLRALIRRSWQALRRVCERMEIEGTQ